MTENMTERQARAAELRTELNRAARELVELGPVENTGHLLANIESAADKLRKFTRDSGRKKRKRDHESDSVARSVRGSLDSLAVRVSEGRTVETDGGPKFIAADFTEVGELVALRKHLDELIDAAVVAHMQRQDGPSVGAMADVIGVTRRQMYNRYGSQMGER